MKKFEGKGVYKDRNGVTYSGDFLAGKRHGFGSLETPQVKFEGYFEDEQQHGSGKMEFGGYSFEGEWVRD